MKYNKCVFINAYHKPNYEDKNKIDYYVSFVGVDTFRGDTLIGINAKCDEENYDKVKKLEFGESPLSIIYTQNKGYFKIEEILSVPSQEQENKKK